MLNLFSFLFIIFHFVPFLCGVRRALSWWYSWIDWPMDGRRDMHSIWKSQKPGKNYIRVVVVERKRRAEEKKRFLIWFFIVILLFYDILQSETAASQLCKRQPKMMVFIDWRVSEEERRWWWKKKLTWLEYGDWSLMRCVARFVPITLLSNRCVFIAGAVWVWISAVKIRTKRYICGS